MATKKQLEEELTQLQAQLASIQKTAKVGVNLTLPIDVRDRLKRSSAIHGVTMSDLVVTALARYLDDLDDGDDI